MEITTHFGDGVRTHVISGAVTFDELIAALRTIYQHPEFDPSHHSLWDLRQGDVTGIDGPHVRGLADVVRVTWGKAGRPRAAIVVAKDFDFGLARMYELSLGSIGSGEVQVFRSINDAHVWLGVVPDAPAGPHE